MNSNRISFKTYNFASHAHYPCIAALDDDHVVVGCWSGILRYIRLEPFEVINTLDVRLFVRETPLGLVRSIRTHPENVLRCAAAVDLAHAVVWDVKQNSSKQVHSTEWPVTSVEWYRNEEPNNILILGTGMYALDSKLPQARLEFWDTEGEEPSLLESVAITGCHVDAIFSDQKSSRIYVYSGIKSQKRGFLTVLDQSSLLPIAIADFPWWGARSIDVVGDTIILRFTDSIQAISIDSWRPRWHRDLSEELSKMPGYVLDCAFSSDLKGMLLSNSEVVSLNDGETQFHLPPLEKCGELITLGDERIAGVSSRGKIGVWEILPEPVA